MTVINVSALGISSDEEDRALLKISPKEYDTRVNFEIDKYYSTDQPRTSQDLKNLTFAETTDLLDLTNTYSYLCPATISEGEVEIDLIAQGEALWDSTKYQDVYTKSLAAPDNPGLEPLSLGLTALESTLNGLSSLGISITTAPTLSPVSVDNTTGPYIDPKDVLGDNTKFVEQDIFRFEVLKELTPLEQAQANTILTSVSDLFVKTTSVQSFEISSISISDFDLNISTNTVDQNLRNPGPANDRTMLGMPPQFKSLILGRSKSTRKNWLNEAKDPMVDAASAGMMQFNYLEIQEVQVLTGYDVDVKMPSYAKLTKEMVDDIRDNGGTLFCRTVRYQSDKIIPSVKRKLNYRTIDQYFIINEKAKGQTQGKRPPSPLTQFGQSLKKQLIKLQDEIRLHEQAGEEIEATGSDSLDEGSGY